MLSDQEILCVHYFYPPIRSGGVIRNYFFSKAFAKQFRHVHVITTSNVDVMDQEFMDIPDNISIYKAKTKDFRSIKSAGNHISMNAKKSVIFQAAAKLKKTLPFHFYLDEGGQIYIRNAQEIAMNIIANHPISHLFSSFMPYADHLIASRVKAKYPYISWIADFRDLQQEPIYKNIYFPRWNRKQEKNILKNADLVTTISLGLVHSIEGIHPKIISIPRGIEVQEYHEKQDKIFRIAYTGSLFYNYRDGLFFVRAFAQSIEHLGLKSDEVKFVYAGRESARWRAWFESCGIIQYLEDRGFVPRSESQTIQAHANLLLLLTSSTEEHQGVFTGKLFEYLETLNPILNVINGVHDAEFHQLFDELQAGAIYYPDQKEQMVDYICTMITNNKEGRGPKLSKQAIDNRKAISWEARVNTMLNEV